MHRGTVLLPTPRACAKSVFASGENGDGTHGVRLLFEPRRLLVQLLRLVNEQLDLLASIDHLLCTRRVSCVRAYAHAIWVRCSRCASCSEP